LPFAVVELAQEQADAAHNQTKLYDAYATATAAVTRGSNAAGLGLDVPIEQQNAAYMQYYNQQQLSMYGNNAQAAAYAAWYASQVYQKPDGTWVYPQQTAATATSAGTGEMAPMSREQAAMAQAQNDALTSAESEAAAAQQLADAANSFSALLDKIDASTAKS
jgi:hypothetical protein